MAVSSCEGAAAVLAGFALAFDPLAGAGLTVFKASRLAARVVGEITYDPYCIVGNSPTSPSCGKCCGECEYCDVFVHILVFVLLDIGWPAT